jgi:hypothetical protein
MVKQTRAKGWIVISITPGDEVLITGVTGEHMLDVYNAASAEWAKMNHTDARIMYFGKGRLQENQIEELKVLVDAAIAEKQKEQQDVLGDKQV